MKYSLFFCLLLASCGPGGIEYDYAYKVHLADGTTTRLVSNVRLEPGESFHAATHGTVVLQEFAEGKVQGTVLSEIAP